MPLSRQASCGKSKLLELASIRLVSLFNLDGFYDHTTKLEMIVLVGGAIKLEICSKLLRRQH